MARSRSRLVGALLLVGVVTSACVSPGDPGVAVENLEADLVFGIEEPTPPVAPGNTNPGPIPSDALDNGFDMSTFRNPAADRLPPLPGDGAPAEETCPKAPPTAAAEVPVDATITGPPVEGVYLWQRSGTQIVPGTGDEEPVTSQITGFERRIIRNVQPYDDPFDPEAYTFEMVQTLLDEPVVQVRTFLVKPQTTAQVAPGGALVVDEPRVNDPEGGISLIKVEDFDEDDQRLGTYEPSNGLLLLGLPVDPAETFQATAIDAKTGQVILQDAAVRGRARIDACGDLVDGWRVETSQVRSDVVGEVEYNAVFATQYGGVPILEEVSTVTAEGLETHVTFTLGQLRPDPLEPA